MTADNSTPAGIFGIDLGTTYSAISRIDEFGKAVVIKDEISGLDTTPSVVYFENDTSIVVGQAAKEAAISHPDQVVSLVKREMGTKGWGTRVLRRFLHAARDLGTDSRET